MAAALAQQESGAAAQPAGPRVPQEINAWLHVGETNIVTVFTGKAELGQNTRTTMALLVADELHVPLENVKMVMADTSRTPWDRGTIGSESTPVMGMQLRRACSAARELIVAHAAAQWKVDAKHLVVAGGKVSDPASHRSATYAELVKGQELVQVIPVDDPPAAPTAWTVAGKPTHKIEGLEFVTGAHRYTSDIKMPGMLYGRMVRPSAIGATLDTIDTSAADSMAGVAVVHDGDFVGVAAPEPRSGRARRRSHQG